MDARIAAAVSVLVALLPSCSSTANGDAGVTRGGAGGSGAGGDSAGSAGSGGVYGSAGSGGLGGATPGGAGTPNGGSGGAGANGGSSGAANGGSAGAALANGGAGQSGNAGAGGSGGASAPTSFTCNQITAMTLTREWFEAGFQSDAGIIDGRWQLKAREHGYITEWANPSSDFWNEVLESPCTAGSTNPDHVVLTVLSWVPACCTTQPQWEAQIHAAVTSLQAKYSALERVDLMTVIRGPGNMLCPTPPAAGETIVIPPELDAALAATQAQFPGLVFVAPKFEAPSCAAFNGGGPHLLTAGNTAVAKSIAAYFADLQ